MNKPIQLPIQLVPGPLLSPNHIRFCDISCEYARLTHTKREQGEILAMVRDGGLFSDSFATFEAYYKAQWGLNVFDVNRLLAAAGKELEPTEGATCIRGSVYVIRANGTCKIGRSSSRDPEQRIASIQSSCPVAIEKLLVIECHDPSYTEGKLHERFKQKRIRGEWFSLTKADLAEIQSDYADTLSYASTNL